MYDDDDEDDPRSRGKYLALVGLLLIGGWFGYRKVLGSDRANVAVGLDPPAMTTAPPPAQPGSSEVATEPSTTTPPVTTGLPATDPTRALVRPSTSTIVPIGTRPTSTVPAAAGSMLPNGVPIGALVTFDGAAVTMRGALPTERARNRLLMLVTAANVAGKPIVNDVAVDPDAPGGDSVRLVGLDPRAFPEGTNDIHPPHASELDRLAILFHAFPNTTIVVVGRADQRGPAARNFEIAASRAGTLVDYLISRGVDADRLIPVSFGELQPPNPDDNVVALTLNRRAEFVLYGLSR